MRRTLPHEGDWRFVSRFLWLPLTLNGEMRWLERATIAQRFVESCIISPSWWNSEFWYDSPWQSVEIHAAYADRWDREKMEAAGIYIEPHIVCNCPPAPPPPPPPYETGDECKRPTMQGGGA